MLTQQSKYLIKAQIVMFSQTVEVVLGLFDVCF